MKKNYALSVLSGLCMSLAGFSAFAQAPANDACSGAQLITASADSTCNPTMGSFINSNQENPPYSCTGQTSPGAFDVWYKFSASATKQIIDVNSATAGLVAAVYDNCGGTVLACGNPQIFFGGAFVLPGKTTVAVSGLTQGTTYYVRVYAYKATADSGSFTICVRQFPPAPANDICSNAQLITAAADTSCNGTLGSLTGASQEFPSDSCSGLVRSGSAYDVWYKFKALAATEVVSVTSPNNGMSAVLYNACGGSPIACGNPASTFGFTQPGTTSFTATGLTVNNFYYVRVYAYTSAPTSGSFSICVHAAPPPPANDLCSSAQTLTVGNSCNPTNGTLTGATETGSASTCGAAPASASAYDVWYQFVAGSANQTIEVTSPSIGGVIDLYTSCGGTQLACANPQIIGGNGRPGTTRLKATGLTVGTTYFIRVYHYGATVPPNGNFGICVYNTPPPPANDDCSGAIMITPAVKKSACVTLTTVNTVGATQSTPHASCSNASTDDDVWYYFTATDTVMTVAASNYTGGITRFGASLFKGSCAGIQDSADCRAGSTGDSIVFHKLTKGTTYYLELFSNGTAATGTFQVCVYGRGALTAIASHVVESTLSIAPNPASQLVRINFSANSSSLSVKMINVSGQVVFSEVYSQYNADYSKTIDLSGYANGIYLLQITTDKESLTRKVVKQ